MHVGVDASFIPFHECHSKDRRTQHCVRPIRNDTVSCHWLWTDGDSRKTVDTESWLFCVIFGAGTIVRLLSHHEMLECLGCIYANEGACWAKECPCS